MTTAPRERQRARLIALAQEAFNIADAFQADMLETDYALRALVFRGIPYDHAVSFLTTCTARPLDQH